MYHTLDLKETFEQIETLENDLSFLERLVAIDSRSKNTAGVQEVQLHLKSKLEMMGFTVSLEKNEFHPSADLLVATLPGDLPFQVTLVGHGDTVLGPTRNHFFRQESAHHLTGPGIADNKGGLCVALRGLRQFLDLDVKRPTLVFVSSPNEELGSLGLHQRFRAIGESSDLVLGFEPSLKNGDLIKGRHGNRWYRMMLKGRPFHAGRFGEPALNAAHEAAIKIAKLVALNDPARRLKVNVGSFKGGSGHFNIVCGDAEVQLDIRFPCLKTRDELHHQILEIFQTPHIFCEVTQAACKMSFDIEDDCPPMASSLDSEGFTDFYLESIAKVEGQRPEAGFTGGAADINYFSTENNFCLDGLGPVAGGMHTVHEYVERSSLLSRARSLSLFLYQLSHLGFRPRRGL